MVTLLAVMVIGDGDGFCLRAFGGYENGGKKSGTKMAGRKSCTTPR